MSNVDHKHEMEDALSVAKGARGSALATEKILLAQVHATALLVDQQRIANLIAVVDATYANGSAAFSSINDPAASEVIATLGVTLGIEPFKVVAS